MTINTLRRDLNKIEEVINLVYDNSLDGYLDDEESKLIEKLLDKIESEITDILSIKELALLNNTNLRRLKAMLYITLKGSSKRLYINLSILKAITVGVLLLLGMFYVSNQEYLTLIK